MMNWCSIVTNPNWMKELIKSEMEHAYELSVPLDVEVGIGENWLEAH